MSGFISCGMCSKDGWVVAKNSDGSFRAVRCTCWQAHFALLEVRKSA